MTPALVPEWVDASQLLPEADTCVPEEKQAQVDYQKESRGPLVPTATSANLARVFTYAVAAHLCSGPERTMLQQMHFNANTYK